MKEPTVSAQPYTLGQIIYVVLSKEAKIYPMQIIKISVEKTLESEATTYMIQAGPEPSKVLSLSDIDGELFESTEEARKVLVDRVTRVVTQRIDGAILKARQWYPTGFEARPRDPLDMIKKSPNPQASPVSSMVKREVAELGNELAMEAEEIATMEVPDGNGGYVKARVKSVKLPSTLS